MNNLIFTPDIDRGAYERIIDAAASQMRIGTEAFKESYKVFPGQLVLPIQLSPSVSSYQVSPRKGVNPFINGEIKLDQNDFFGVTGIGLRFGRATYSSDTGLYSNHGSFEKLTWPYEDVFTGSGEASALNNILNGTVSLSVSGDVLVDSLLGQDLCYKAQQATGSASDSINFGGDSGKRGYFPLTPQILLDASADNTLTVQLATGTITNIDGNTNATTRNLLYVMLWGWKIKNLSGKGLSACKV